MNLEQRAFREPKLWVSVWKLLRLSLLIQINAFRRAKLKAKIWSLVAVLGLLVFLGFILFLSISLLWFLRSPQLAEYIGDTAPILESIPTLVMSASAVAVLLTGFSLLLRALYLSGDMSYLMSTPISIRAVFIAKLVQAVLPNFGMICLFTLPVLFGLGISGGYNVLYYPAVILALALISLAAAALASLLVMVAARFFPAHRLAEVLGFVIGMVFFIFSQSSRFMNFEVNKQQVTSLVALSTRFSQSWSPMTWIGQGLILLGKANTDPLSWLKAAGLLAGAFLLIGAIFVAALVTSERLYYTGWSSLQNNRRRKTKPGFAAAHTVQGQAQRSGKPLAGFSPAAAAHRFRLIPAPVRAIIVKDMLMYRRDLRHISQLLTPLILGVVYAIGLLQSGGQGVQGRGEAPAFFLAAVTGMMIYADVALALFLGWMLVMNLAGAGFSQEGKQYWILKAAPVSARQLLTAKFLVAFLPTLLLCWVYLLVLQFLKGTALWSMLISLAAVALTLAGLTGIYLAFGVRGAIFNWDNPNKMNGAVGCLGSLAGMIYLLICFGFFIVPPLLAGLLNLPTAAGQFVGLLLGSAACVAAVIIPLRLVEKRVAILAEE
jgi:ABC-2 type transport system permease protein